MRQARYCSRFSTAPLRKRWLSPWGIRTWQVIFPTPKITFAHFRTRPCRKWPRSRPCLGRFRFAAICRSRFPMSRSAAPDSSVRRRLPKEDPAMRKTRFDFLFAFLFALSTGAILLLSACSLNVKKEQNGEDKQVDIQTPMGGIHVSKGASPEDVGIAIYPGARLKQKDSDGDDKSANVNISGFGYGLKVVALQYESNDSPSKVVDYYKDQLKRYGKVLVCHTSHMDVDADLKDQDENHGSHELSCEGKSGVTVELKVGTKENQHIVAVEPAGTGSSFSLVDLRTHGKDADI